MRRIAAAALLTGLYVLVAAASLWGVLALYYTGLADDSARNDLAAAFAVASLAALVALGFRGWRWPVLIVHLALFGTVLFWHLSKEPSNDRDWQVDVAVLPYATIETDVVTVHRIRNFEYRSETEYIPAYYDKRFELRNLQGVDLVAVYWMGPSIAHTFLSFAFAGDEHLAISIETRKEKMEGYSTIEGFFRQYELYYVVADERDVIRLRTNYRNAPAEQVYVYRVTGPLENGRQLFLEYMKQINALRTQPQFYNTLTSNCTTAIWYNTLVNAEHLPFSWKILASGYVPQYLHEAGRLDTSVRFPDLMQRAHVNARARAAGEAAEFSRLIRSGSEAQSPGAGPEIASHSRDEPPR